MSLNGHNVIACQYELDVALHRYSHRGCPATPSTALSHARRSEPSPYYSQELEKLVETSSAMEVVDVLNTRTGSGRLAVTSPAEVW